MTSHEPAEYGSGRLMISETFISRQGEGKLTCVESFFIRTSGCNLRCWFCDTPYASWQPEGKSFTIEQLMEQISQLSTKYVVLTGGEPLLASAYQVLVKTLQASGLHVTVETAGTIEKPMPVDLLSLSPKLSGSGPDKTENHRWSVLHEQRRLPIHVMKRLLEAAREIQIKFVVSHPTQLEEICDVVDRLGVAAEHVFLMPEGTTIQAMDNARQWLLPMCQSTGFQPCDRMQIRWYGNRRGT
ncbi:MAG: 7-carboxy-7-deazaguanine synthase QueE [Planctomycetota bacterium]